MKTSKVKTVVIISMAALVLVLGTYIVTESYLPIHAKNHVIQESLATTSTSAHVEITTSNAALVSTTAASATVNTSDSAIVIKLKPLTGDPSSSFTTTRRALLKTTDTDPMYAGPKPLLAYDNFIDEYNATYDLNASIFMNLGNQFGHVDTETDLNIWRGINSWTFSHALWEGLKMPLWVLGGNAKVQRPMFDIRYGLCSLPHDQGVNLFTGLYQEYGNDTRFVYMIDQLPPFYRCRAAFMVNKPMAGFLTPMDPTVRARVINFVDTYTIKYFTDTTDAYSYLCQNLDLFNIANPDVTGNKNDIIAFTAYCTLDTYLHDIGKLSYPVQPKSDASVVTVDPTTTQAPASTTYQQGD